MKEVFHAHNIKIDEDENFLRQANMLTKNMKTLKTRFTKKDRKQSHSQKNINVNASYWQDDHTMWIHKSTMEFIVY